VLRYPNYFFLLLAFFLRPFFLPAFFAVPFDAFFFLRVAMVLLLQHLASLTVARQASS